MSEELLHVASPLQLQHAMSRRHILAGAGALVTAGSATTAFAQNAPEGGKVPIPSHLRFIQPETSSRQVGYSHVVEATVPGRIVYIAGQMGLDINGNLVGAPGDFKAQAAQAFENLRARSLPSAAATSTS